MSIITTITPVYKISTSIAYGNQTATVTTINTGIVGPRGEPGPLYTGDDLPDFTLIFDNKLI